MQQVNGQKDLVEQTDDNLQNLEDLLRLLRNTTSKVDSYERLKAYVLGVKYPNEIYCLYETESDVLNNFDISTYNSLSEANEQEVTEIEEQTGNVGWLHYLLSKSGSGEAAVKYVACDGYDYASHYATSCSLCPYDENGHYHGGFRCGGDCRWTDNECKQGLTE